MAKLKEGARVEFYRSHDKSTKLTGRIAKLHADGKSADVKFEVDGKKVLAERVDTVSLADCTEIGESKESEKAAAEKASAEKAAAEKAAADEGAQAAAQSQQE